jgi:hypothetical protein
MDLVWAGARKNIGHWTHIAAKRGDWMIRLGQLFDGRIGWDRTMSRADQNVLIPKMGHTGVFNDPQFFRYWPELIVPMIAAPDWQIGARTVPHA